MSFDALPLAHEPTSQRHPFEPSPTRIGATLTACAYRAAELLEPESKRGVAAFIQGRLCTNGGFRGRSLNPDVYYTLFALQCLRALDEQVPAASRNELLEHRPDNLDLVHLSCYARARALLASNPGEYREATLSSLAHHRLTNGAYRLTHQESSGSLYAGFLAMLTCEACAVPLADPAGLLDFIARCRCADGAYADHPGAAEGTTTVTAAAAVCLLSLGEAAEGSTLQWLLNRTRADGGFTATPSISVPDLLSTATALFALKLSGIGISHLAPTCFSFISEMWHPSGGFAGSRFDPIPDCEYSYYALLALGTLAEAL